MLEVLVLPNLVKPLLLILYIGYKYNLLILPNYSFLYNKFSKLHLYLALRI